MSAQGLFGHPGVTDTMDFNYRTHAALFAPNGRGGILAYRRFATVAEAIRFVIEELSPAQQRRAFIDVGDETLSGEGIRALYDNKNYPLRQRGQNGPLPVNA
jgi:hypothetical protein